jgi:hypothetical protein
MRAACRLPMNLSPTKFPLFCGNFPDRELKSCCKPYFGLISGTTRELKKYDRTNRSKHTAAVRIVAPAAGKLRRAPVEHKRQQKNDRTNQSKHTTAVRIVAPAAGKLRRATVEYKRQQRVTRPSSPLGNYHDGPR